MPRHLAFAPRRQFLKTALQAGAALAVPYVVPGAVLGKDGAVPPSEQIVMAGLGIGGRGSYDIGCFMREPDVRFVACCDVRADRRQRHQAEDRRQVRHGQIAPNIATSARCWPGPTSTPCSSPPARTGTPCFRSTRPRPARTCIARSPAARPSPKAWPWPTPSAARPGCSRAACSGATCRTSSLRPSWPGRGSSASCRPCTPIRAGWHRHQRLAAAAARAAQGRGRLGHVPRPRGLAALQLRLLNSGFEKGGGMVGGGCLEWGSHCIDMCQWANQRRRHGPRRILPAGKRPGHGPLCQRREAGRAQRRLAPAGLLPRAVSKATTGWVETGDSGKLALSSPALLRRQNSRRDRRLPGHLPHPRFPQLREVAGPAAGQRPGGLPVAHRLPRREHRHLPEPQAQVRSARRTSSSATNRPTGSAAKPSASRGRCEEAGSGIDGKRGLH